MYIVVMIVSLNKSAQWLQSKIKPDIGINNINNFFHNFKFHVFMCYNHLVNDSEYSVANCHEIFFIIHLMVVIRET